MIYQIGDYRFDAFLRVSPSLSATVSGDRLEDGARYTDHREVNPVSLTIEGVISDDPIGEMVGVRAAERVDAAGLGAYSPTIYGRARLEEMADSPEGFDIVTAQRTYRDYVFESLIFDELSGVMRPSMKFTQRRLVSLRRELLGVRRARPRARGTVDMGVDPIGNLLEAGRSIGESLKELGGIRPSILDADGKALAEYDPIKKIWIARDGNQIDPFDPKEKWRLPRGNRDLGTGAITGDSGTPIARTPGERFQRALGSDEQGRGLGHRITDKLSPSTPWWAGK